MKRIIIIWVLFISAVSVKAQGSGFGYMADFGGSTFSQPTAEYDQVIRSFAHNGFIRFHSASGYNALQFLVGYKSETVPFQNFSDFLSPDGNEMMKYNTDAQIKRKTWKFGLINQLQFVRKPGKLMYSFNSGLFYERTVKATRNDYNGDWTYDLEQEIIPHNLGLILGAELRFGWFTIGYKMEKLFWDVLDHDYILTQDLNMSNSSELRGLKLNPWMNYLYLGVNIDFFSEKEEE